MDPHGSQSVPTAVPIPVKDLRVVSGGFTECQHFGEFTIGPIAGSNMFIIRRNCIRIYSCYPIVPDADL